MAVTILRTVRPSPQWQDTLIRLQAGQRVVIDTEETWSPDMQNQIVWCGADGVYNLQAGEGYLLPGANVGALIARVGEGRPFAVGSRSDFRAEGEGILYFAMNEHPQRHCQAGKLLSQVIVFGDFSG
ncbi:MAG: hypothetical protein IT369_04375 [Candidatus Latescibacteria bacterium]|nr:hypothetical protein [Candidatus Latescibacterota bacterium]